jgi:hypothetical protein
LCFLVLTMRVLVLLLGAAALLRKDKPTPRMKLEKVEKGFAAVLKASPVLEDLVSPMLKEVKAALEEKDDKKVNAVLDEFPKWQKEMGERQLQITNAGDSERTTLLVAVLQNKQDLPVSEQLEVVRAADFTGLPVVRFIEDHSDDKTPLVNLALKFIDGDKAAPVEAPATNSTPPNLDDIVKMLEGHQHSAEERLDQIAKREKLLEKTFKNLKKDDKQVKFLRRREERKLAKDKAVQTKTMTALKDAIKDIKNKDAKGLLEAKKALQESMEALQEQNGEFLHFLQTTAPGFSCPYCGAQCIEKCVSTEHKTMSGCLSECLAKNPTEKN